MDEQHEGVHLSPMAHLAEAKSVEDDWSGISDWPARKQRQNRLNQRAYRRRKKLLNNQTEGPSLPSKRTPSGRQGLSLGYERGAVNSNAKITPQKAQREIQNEAQAPWVYGDLERHKGSATCRAHPDRPGTFVVKVASKTITFDLYEPAPIFSDHLLSLIRYNLYRAVAQNSWLIGIDPRLMHSDIISPFNLDDKTVDDLCFSLPPALRPTALQRSIPHHPYIDLFPFPVMRDRIIQLGDTLDEDALCADFAGETIHPESGGHTGLIVWGEPWDPQNWEIAEELWKKWSSLLVDCPGLLEVTNHWRRRRDEQSILGV